MSDRPTLRFVAYNGAYGHVYFGDEMLGPAEMLADGLYVPFQGRNARTLHQCALHLAGKSAGRAEKEFRKAERIVSAIASLHEGA